MATQDDRRLGMHVPITRRDFVNGLAIGAGAAAASQWLPAGMADLLAQDAGVGLVGQFQGVGAVPLSKHHRDDFSGNQPVDPKTRLQLLEQHFSLPVR